MTYHDYILNRIAEMEKTSLINAKERLLSAMADQIEISKGDLRDIVVYLFELQESGETNMWGASAYIEMDFDHLPSRSPSKILAWWIEHYTTLKAEIDYL